MQQFTYEVTHRPGDKLPEADALSRLHIPLVANTEKVCAIGIWEGTEEIRPQGEKFYVPETCRPRILRLYHDSSESGGHDGLSKTFRKINQRFTWESMKEDVHEYVRTCHLCQMAKAKYKPRGNEMVIPKYSSVPFEVVHLDFAEVKKKAEGVWKTHAFLVAIDECTRMAAAKCGKEDANSVIALMERVIFKTTKVLVSDNGPAFRSEKLRRWAEQRGITLRFSTPYHPEGNALAERLIRDLKKYLDLYPTFPGGWKCALEAAVTHHNNTYTEGLGCSPYFCANGTSPWLPADHQ